MAPMLEVRDLVKIYSTAADEVPALGGVSLTVERGEFVALMGPSGSGKSTLMNIIGCLDTPTAGTYVLDGVDVSELDEEQLSEIRATRIGFVFQSFNLLPRAHRAAQRGAADDLHPHAALRARAPFDQGAGGRGSRREPVAAQEQRAFRGPDAARGDRPRARQRPGDHPRRRADRQPRFAHGRADPRDVPRPAAAGAHDPPHHPRSRDRSARRPRGQHPRRADREQRGRGRTGRRVGEGVAS